MKMRRLLLGLLVLAWAAGAAAADLKAGAWVTVNKDGAEVKKGNEVVATLKKGQRLKLYWLPADKKHAMIYCKVRGETLQGYISLKDVDAAPGTEEKATPKNPFVADDRVIVIAKEAKLKVGEKVVGTVPEGTPLTVKRVKDEWLGVTVDIKGKATFGWIHAREVDYPSLKDQQKTPPKKAPSKDKRSEKAEE